MSPVHDRASASSSTPSAPDCLGPLPDIAPPSFDIPRGACDTHAHVIARDPAYPLVAARSYTPPAAPLHDYLKMLDGCGMDRGVLVQVSVHGTDNRYMLEALHAHPTRLRGVAVVDASVTDAALMAMHDAGVRGVRLNVLFGGGVGFDHMEALADRIAPLGWHMQFLMDVRHLPPLAPRLRKLKLPCVFDHMGHMPVTDGMSSAGFETLRQGVAHDGWWVKLSGAYRISEDFDRYDDVTPWAQALIAAAPERMVWGSDWPHVAIPRMPDTGTLRNLLPKWAPDAATRHAILVENPQTLYDFPPI